MELARRPKLRHARPGTAVLAKGRQRGEAILDAATRLLIDEGYAQLTTRKIAARAGMHAGNLQYYYRTKADVVRALLERYLDGAIGGLEARIAAAGQAPAARLRAMVDGILDDQGSAACRMFWEIWALAARDALVGRAANAFYDRYRDGVAAALLAAAPGLGAARARRRAALLVALLEGLTVWRLAGGRQRRLDDGLARELRALLPCFAEED